MNQVIARSEARERGLKRYFTAEPCKRGHVAERMASNKCCITCFYARNRAARAADLEAARAKDRAWRKANTHRRVGKSTDWFRANPERARELKLAWNTANAEKIKVQSRANRQANLDRDAAKTRMKKALKLKATPAWVDLAAVSAVYSESVRLFRETGVKHEVDHIVPLQGRNVCGLHVHYNLRAIPAIDNRRKHNRLIETLVLPGVSNVVD